MAARNRNKLELKVAYKSLREAWKVGGTAKESVFQEIHSSWREFLEAGFDPQKVLEMMPTITILNHFEEVKKYVDIDINKLAHQFNSEYVRLNWDRFIFLDADPDKLADSALDIICLEYVKEAISLGISFKKIAGLSLRWLEEGSVDDCYRFAQTLSDEGCPADELQEIICEWGWPDIVNDIVEDSPARWSEYVEPKQFFGPWLELNGDRAFGRDGLTNIIEVEIPLSTWLESFRMDQIIELSSYDGFWLFLEDWLHHNHSLYDIANKFIDEIGYENAGKPEAISAAIDLILMGAQLDQTELAKHIALNADQAETILHYIGGNELVMPCIIDALRACE